MDVKIIIDSIEDDWPLDINSNELDTDTEIVVSVETYNYLYSAKVEDEDTGMLVSKWSITVLDTIGVDKTSADIDVDNFIEQLIADEIELYGKIAAEFSDKLIATTIYVQVSNKIDKL